MVMAVVGRTGVSLKPRMSRLTVSVMVLSPLPESVTEKEKVA